MEYRPFHTDLPINIRLDDSVEIERVDTMSLYVITFNSLNKGELWKKQLPVTLNEDGTVSATFYGKDQVRLGNYSVVLVLNEGLIGMCEYTHPDVFCLSLYDNLKYDRIDIVIELSDAWKSTVSDFVESAFQDAMETRVVLLSDVEYAAIAEAGLVDPSKIYLVYEQEEPEPEPGSGSGSGSRS